jgi:hypothetical protein
MMTTGSTSGCTRSWPGSFFGRDIAIVPRPFLPELETILEMKVFHGAGETFWIRKGKIVSMSGPGLNLDRFKPNTIALLALP